MSLDPGTRLGKYEILDRLGAGGMGEVYRARDTQLGRAVALKTLPDVFTRDPERLARFRREAQLLAALNHPHIASIYGVEEAGGCRFLVLELVEGETLASRIAKGPVAVDEALALARQTGEALEAAHEKGIIHRDLKPSNIALTADDRVKVLDFGLAKATVDAVTDAASAVDSPTVTSPIGATGVGVILGTAAYMSPEQAKGRVADKRSDVWAFGCVLFEMLTGKRAFPGDDVSDTLAAVLKTDPDWSALPPLPPAVRGLLQGCLQKDRRKRVGDIAAALFVLQHPSEPGDTTAQPAFRMRGRAWAWGPALVVVGALLGAGLMSLGNKVPEETLPITRFIIPVPDARQVMLSRRAVAVSPDGTQIAYTAEGRLFLRSISEFESRAVQGANEGLGPVFSPDGQWILFWEGAYLKRVSAGGGVAMTICGTTPAPFGVSWTADGIVFVEPGTGIMRVQPAGGTPELLVRVTDSDGLAQRPQLLPGGEHVLFSLVREQVPSANYWDKADVVAHSIRTGARKTIIKGGSSASYVPSGHLVYLVEGTILAVPFDVQALEVKGAPVPIIEGVMRTPAVVGGDGHYMFSDSGVFAYVRGPSRTAQQDVYFYDRAGNAEPLRLPPGNYMNPRVSPDGKWLALETAGAGDTYISVYELSRQSTLRRLTFGGNNRLPIWSRDSTRVAFQSDRDGSRSVFWQPIDGGAVERLTTAEPGTSHVPEAWSPTEDLFVFSIMKGSTASLWSYSVRDRRSSPVQGVTSAAFPTNAVFSPDGRWIAYQSGDAGTGEATTYVQPFPPTGTKFEIARGGRALWSRDGKELFFVPAPTQFKVLSVQTKPAFAFTEPVPIPRRFGLAPPLNPRPYDMLPDGRLVGVNAVGDDEASAPQIRVIQNWFQEIRARIK